MVINRIYAFHLYKKFMKKIALFALSALLCVSCASITGSETQHLAVSTFYKGRQIDDVACTLINNKGQWNIDPQGNAYVRKSRSDLTITCGKKGLPTKETVVSSKMPDGTWIDFAAGGIIGSTIDTANEVIYEYPEYIIIEMGDSD